jgi:hypothetical protein
MKKKKEFDMSKGWVATDGWRGYSQPIYAVAGASDTGMASDSPAPSTTSKKELNSFASYLKKNNITSKKIISRSSNVFMAKRWIVVAPADYAKSKKLFDKYFAENETQQLHDADDLRKPKEKKITEHKKRRQLKELS